MPPATDGCSPASVRSSDDFPDPDEPQHGEAIAAGDGERHVAKADVPAAVQHVTK